MKAARLASIFALSAGCGTSVSSGPGSVPESGAEDGGEVTDSSPFAAGDAAAIQRLDAYIEQGTVAVNLVTLSCTGDCATVQAVGLGGDPPYTYVWENGSTSAVRRVCPTADTDYSVKVTDTGGAGEIPRPPQTASASVTADVLACPDGGLRDAASPVLSTDGCVGGFVNPSFEGIPRTNVGAAWDVAGWTECPSGANEVYLANQSLGPSYPAPVAGQTYGVIQVDDIKVTVVGFSQQFCAPPAAGTSFRFDAMVLMPDPPGSVGLWVVSGPAACDLSGTQLVDTNLTTSWKTYCFTFDKATPAITFTSAQNTVATALVLIDNIVPVSSCP